MAYEAIAVFCFALLTNDMVLPSTVGTDPSYIHSEPYCTLPNSALLTSNVTLWLSIFVKLAVIVMSCSTVPDADDQESNAYVYCVVSYAGVAVMV